ncbi:MAG: AAA family ATPase [Anaerolineales bacterium]|nr:AAA family ATPase [Anaerolineales bacterium]
MPVPKPMRNPDQKCRNYLRELRAQLTGAESLRVEGQPLKLSVEYFLIFPNISRDEFTSRGFGKMISTTHAIFGDDLENHGEGLVNRYARLLPCLPKTLSQSQQNAITAILDPTIVLPRPAMEDGLITVNPGNVQSEEQSTAVLSLEQEEIAKSMGEGPCLLRGIAGTGKTMILLYGAKLLAANAPEKKLLILCWNIAMANYMRQTYDKLALEAGAQVRIEHFSSFICDLLNLSHRIFDVETDEAYTFLQDQLDLYPISEDDQFDAIFVDEAQDFRKEWITFLFQKMIRGAKPQKRNLIIAADDAQRVYHQRDFNWNSFDFQFSGYSKVLKTIYRNSARIWIFSAFLLEHKAAYAQEAGKLLFANPGKYEPLVLRCKDLDDQIEHAIRMIKNLLKQGFAARNVLILYRHKKIPWLKHYPLVENLTARLDDAGIAWDWVSEDARAKRSFDGESDTVKISTVHAAKGLDSPVVIILGVETFLPDAHQEAQDIDEVNLLYVAMNRAREFLVVMYSGKRGLVENLKHCEREYEKYRYAILAMPHLN